MTPIEITLSAAAFGALLYRGSVWVYRMGFRHAIDFLSGDRPLPRLIVSWRGALRSSASTTNQETHHD